MDVDDTQLLSDVCTTVSRDLVGELFPECAQLWENLVTCPDKLGMLVNYATDRYIQLYLSCTGRDKHAELYLKWLDVTREFTCKSKQTDETATVIEEAFGNLDATPETMRTILAILLNAVYLGVCKQMAIAVEKISASIQQTETTETAKPSDEVAVQRLCGWALKSATDLLKSQSPQSQELKLLASLSLDKDDKPQLPLALQYLDRGGLTFMRPTFLPWMMAVEGKMVQHLNQKSYNQYGEKIFQVQMHVYTCMHAHVNCTFYVQATQTSISMDRTLLTEFREAVIKLDQSFQPEIVEKVHSILFTKLYNARCNEFVRSISKLSCIQENRAVDASVGLRDKLKVYAIHKNSMNKK